MAVITVRIDDAVRDALQAKADEECLSLGDFVRCRLQDAVFREDEGRNGNAGGLERDTVSALERDTLALLRKILACVLPQDANDVDGDQQPEREKVLERDSTKEYPMELVGLQ
ncbi:hypothetical protein [Paenarthrobacter sp. NEAU-H11]|uniref:hypothetical protein n=1 Tax=Paenarthrobacter sp. NEAU-H11 TaxID=3423924 RepID=UPI003D3392F4